LAQKSQVVITATKYVDGVSKSVKYSGSGKDFTLFTAQIKHIEPYGSSDEDSLVLLNDGSIYIGQVAFDDLNTGISATDETGS
jgi:methylaspartate ammonia-lyase